MLKTYKRTWAKLLALGASIALLLGAMGVLTATAVSVPFADSPTASSGGAAGSGEVAPRGFSVQLPSGASTENKWLSSPYDNHGLMPIHTGVVSGVDVLPVKNSEGNDYTFYAYIDKNPNTTVKPFMVIYKDGVVIPDTQYTVGAGERTVDPHGRANEWRVPITGLTLSPGAYYEFAFLRGITSNNGMTGVISEDGTGYLQSPSGSEVAWYDAHKGDEYKYREFKNIYDVANGSYTTFVPNPDYNPASQTYKTMRYSFRTEIDPQSFYDALAAAKKAQTDLKASDVTEGKVTVGAADGLAQVVAKYDVYTADEILAMSPAELTSACAEMENATKPVVDKAGPGYNGSLPVGYIRDAIRDAGPTGTTIVNLSSPDIVPAEIFSMLSDGGGKVEFRIVDTSGNLLYSLTFEGKTIQLEKICDVDLTITCKDSGTVSWLDLQKEDNALAVMFSQKGDFPGPVGIKLGVGSKYADGTELVFVFLGSGEDDIEIYEPLSVKDGFVTFSVEKGSDYLLFPLDEGDDAGSDETTTVIPGTRTIGPKTTTTTIPATGDGFDPVLFAAVAALGALGSVLLSHQLKGKKEL